MRMLGIQSLLSCCKSRMTLMSAFTGFFSIRASGQGVSPARAGLGTGGSLRVLRAHGCIWTHRGPTEIRVKPVRTLQHMELTATGMGGWTL